MTIDWQIPSVILEEGRLPFIAFVLALVANTSSCCNLRYMRNVLEWKMLGCFVECCKDMRNGEI